MTRARLASTLTMRLLIVLLIGALAACSSPAPSAVAHSSATSGPTNAPDTTPPADTPPPTPTQPAETVLCVPEALDSSSPFSGDPCPGALTAVRIAVQSTGLTIARIVLEPYGFSCGELWPGVGSPLICYGPMVMSGTAMHGWVSFAGSPRIAAIYLHRPYPAPGSSSPPDTTWTATIEALAIPPSGWVMP